jgi:hypothetical protein
MSKIVSENRNLNIRYDLPNSMWEKIGEVYENMDGWMGFGNGNTGDKGIPYWYGFDGEKTSISASVEPSGLHFFAANIDEEKWNAWLSDFKSKASEKLGFKVGEIELGEVGYDIEWIK